MPADSVLVVRTTALVELQAAAIRSERPRTDLSTRERETLLKLVIGMAIAGYKYKPDATRNVATKDISGDLGGLGIGMDDDTVRKWLKIAADEVLPKPKT